MKVYKINASLTNVPKLKDKLALCLGYFDGVHIAHQRLINEARIHCEDKVGVITFDSNVKGRKNLTSLSARVNLFKVLGVDYIFVFPFNNQFKNITREQFKEKFFDRLNISALFAGADFAFGKNRQGNIAYLKRYYPVHLVKFVKKANKKISSYDIASFIKRGEVKKAAEYLGRPYQIRGRVTRGFQKGAALNFPTANINILDDYVVPKFGVYKVITYVLGIPRLGIANVGVHPTVNKLSIPIVEVHIPHFKGNLYNQEMYIEFIDFLRPEKKFSGEKALIKQINADLVSLNKR
ncbi:MAG: riboflavin biosynthesis protein RibF [Bacilli bacterium]|nr:riboflavin biosynthesis protein RibF [Bacilli bacterium]